MEIVICIWGYREGDSNWFGLEWIKYSLTNVGGHGVTTRNTDVATFAAAEVSG